MPEWNVVSEQPLRPPPRGASPTGAAPPAGGQWNVVKEQPLDQSMSADIRAGSGAVGITPPTREAMEQPLLEKGQEFLTQREADIDYNTGAPYAVRVGLHRADNPEEAKRYLEQRFGTGNYGQDRFGQWWANIEGKRTAILPKGAPAAESTLGQAADITGRIGGFMVGGPLGAKAGAYIGRNLVNPTIDTAAGMQAQSYPMAGAIGGGIAGELAFPAGGGIPGAMLGAMAGKATDDMIKWAQGILFQSPKEIVSGIAGEGAMAGAFQGAGPLLRGAGQAIKGGLQSFTGTTPITRATAGRVAAEGAVPPIGSVAPEATAIEYKRQLRNILSANPAEARNIEYLTKRMDDVFMREGIPEPERQALQKEIFDTSSRTSTREAGEKVVATAKGFHSTLVNEAQTIRRSLEQQFNRADQQLRQYAQAPQSTAADVSNAIKMARADFSKNMAQIYEKVDSMGGNQKIVPTALIKQQAKELVQVMPPQAVPPLLRFWAEKGSPRNISFAQAHALRSTLREMGEMLDVSPTGVRVGNIRKMAGAVNEAIGSTTSGVGQQAAAELRRADQLYAQGIAKFNNTEINKIVRDLRSGIIPEPGYVASRIMQEDNPELAKTVFKMLPPETQGNVIKADLGNLIESATARQENGELRLDGKSFLEALESHKSIVNAIYSPRVANMLRQYATELAAFDGKIDVTAMKTPTAITNLLEKSVGAMRAADEFASKNPLGAFVSGTPLQVDRALAKITLPGNEAVTEQAVKTLGTDSPAWAAVRKYTLQRLFSGSVVERRSLAKTVSGDEIAKTLNRYTKRQQELLFPGGLADDLRELARESKFLFPERTEDLGTSLAAASIKSKLWLNPLAVWKYARLRFMGYVADHPALLKLLTSDTKKGGAYARSVKSVLAQWAFDQALHGPGHGAPQSGIPFTAPSMLATEDKEPTYGGPQE